MEDHIPKRPDILGRQTSNGLYWMCSSMKITLGSKLFFLYFFHLFPYVEPQPRHQPQLVIEDTSTCVCLSVASFEAYDWSGDLGH